MRLIFFLLFCTCSCLGQVSIPIKFTSEEENKLIKDTDTLKYYEATGDPEKVVCIDEEAAYYKLLGKNRKVIDEGGYIPEEDRLVQDGKWIEHFENGKTKLTGYYRRNKPVGTWKEFYEEGHVKTIYNFGIIVDGDKVISCLAGTYQEFYPDGKLKVNGFYAAARSQGKDTTYVDDPVTGNKVKVVNPSAVYKSEKSGRWEYYTEEGELDKKEDL